jgi:prepilin-type N-terminal cleavage/methylation domain-containing protein
MSSSRNRTGFTLMEILVALTIIVAILAMVYGSFAATTRSIDAFGARMAQLERTCFALRLMTRQLRCAYAPDTSQPAPPGSNGIGTQSGSPPTAGAGQILASKHPMLFRGNCSDSRGEILSFVTSSGLGGGPDAPRGLFRVSYLYDKLSSTLSVSRQDPSDLPDGQVRPIRSDLLLSDVTGVELKFYDGRQWQQAWDAGQRHELPRAVKVEIAVTDGTGRSHLLGTTIPIVEQMSPESANAKRAVAAGQP